MVSGWEASTAWSGEAEHEAGKGRERWGGRKAWVVGWGGLESLDELKLGRG